MKEEKLLLILTLLLLLFFYSCKKNNKTEIFITGQVYSPKTNEYVNDVKVVLMANGIINGVYNPHFQNISNTTTDSYGKFSFKLKKDKIDTYKLVFSKPNYFEEKIQFPSSYFDATNTYFKVVNLYPIGYLKLTFVNAYPYDYEDKIIYYFTNSELTCYNCCDTSINELHGPSIDTSFSCAYYGNTNLFLFRNVIKNNISTIFLDTLYCKAFDTTDYYIAY